MNIAWVMLCALVFAVRDVVAAAATIRPETWRAWAAASPVAWRVTSVTLPAGRVDRYDAEGPVGVVPCIYDAGAALDAAERYQRGAMRFAAALDLPGMLVVAEALVVQHFFDHPEDAEMPEAPPAAVIEAPPPANDVSPASEAPKTSPPRAPAPASLDAFLKLHPRLFDVLAAMAREQLAAGAKRISVNALFEALRGDLERYREACGGTLPPPGKNGHRAHRRLNNTHRAPVARLLAAHAPDVGVALDMRKSRADYDPAVVGRAVARGNRSAAAKRAARGAA